MSKRVEAEVEVEGGGKAGQGEARPGEVRLGEV